MITAELDHFIGLNSNIDIVLHPNREQYLYSSGSNIILTNLLKSNENRLITIHDDFVTALALSNDGTIVASGQKGLNSNVIIWDLSTESIIYTFEEHDNSIQNLLFTHDDRVLVSIGGTDDNKLFFLDMSNGYIIASSRVPTGTVCVATGGYVKDIKRRNTDKYLFATAGSNGIVLWVLDPFEGQVEAVPIQGDPRATISRHITSLSFSDDGEYLFAGTTSG